MKEQARILLFKSIKESNIKIFDNIFDEIFDKKNKKVTELDTIRDENSRTLLHQCVRYLNDYCARRVFSHFSQIEDSKCLFKVKQIERELNLLQREEYTTNNEEILRLKKKRRKIRRTCALRKEEAYSKLLKARDKHGRTVLHFAANSNGFPLDVLLMGGVNLQSKHDLNALTRKDIQDLQSNRREILDLRDDNGRTALHFASYHGVPSIIRILIRAGSNPYLKDQHEHTPLSVAKDSLTRRAIINASSDLVGLDLEIERGGEDFLDDNEEEEETDITKISVIRSLVLNDPSGIEAMLGTRMGMRSETCLHVAASECDVALARALLEQGANLFSRDASGFTAFHTLARACALSSSKKRKTCISTQQWVEFAKLLIKKDSKILSEISSKGHTAVHIFVRTQTKNKHLRFLRYILRVQNSNPNSYVFMCSNSLHL